MKYKVGKFKFELNNETDIDYESLFYIFKSNEETDYKINITFNDQYDEYENVIYSDDRLIVYKSNDCLEIRRYYHPIYKYPTIWE